MMWEKRNKEVYADISWNFMYITFSVQRKLYWDVLHWHRIPAEHGVTISKLWEKGCEAALLVYETEYLHTNSKTLLLWCGKSEISKFKLISEISCISSSQYNERFIEMCVTDTEYLLKMG